MKRLVLIIGFVPIISFGQQDREVGIEFNARTTFHEVNDQYLPLEDTIFHADAGFIIRPGYDIEKLTIGGKTDEYVIFTYPDFKNDDVSSGRGSQGQILLAAGNSPVHADLISKNSAGNLVARNGKKLAMKKTDFDLLDKTDLYATSWCRIRNYRITTGVMSLPFKFRPAIDTTEFSITTDVTIGPYFGFTKRLSKRRDVFLSIPATLGVSFINIQNNNTFDVNDGGEEGLVAGVTWSTGLVFQYEDFSAGFVLGQDYASNVGDRWKYNGQMWYSFAIGYNFLKPKEERKKK